LYHKKRQNQRENQIVYKKMTAKFTKTQKDIAKKQKLW